MNLGASFPLLLAQQLPDPRASWAPVVLLLLIGIGFVAGNVILSAWIGPKRTGPGKEAPYESGMVPVGDARRRFNVRFYVVAMIFLVFDVEIVFFYPFATIFAPYVRAEQGGAVAAGTSTVILASMLVFIGILLLAYLYAWGKGVFRWD
jgi:NADH-quinone oxidoreductase subunit A